MATTTMLLPLDAAGLLLPAFEGTGSMSTVSSRRGTDLPAVIASLAAESLL